MSDLKNSKSHTEDNDDGEEMRDFLKRVPEEYQDGLQSLWERVYAAGQIRGTSHINSAKYADTACWHWLKRFASAWFAENYVPKYDGEQRPRRSERAA